MLKKGHEHAMHSFVSEFFGETAELSSFQGSSCRLFCLFLFIKEQLKTIGVYLEISIGIKIVI